MKKINQNLNTESEEEEAPIIEVLNISTTNEQLIINKYNNPIEQARNYSLKLRELIKSETSKKKFQIKNLIVFVNPNNHNTVFTYINNQDEYIELDMKNEFFDLDKFTTICSIDNFNTWLSKNINKDDESLTSTFNEHKEIIESTTIKKERTISAKGKKVNQWNINDKVSHKFYGNGIIIAIISYTLIRVKFDKVGNKTIYSYNLVKK